MTRKAENCVEALSGSEDSIFWSNHDAKGMGGSQAEICVGASSDTVDSRMFKIWSPGVVWGYNDQKTKSIPQTFKQQEFKSRYGYLLA